MLGYVIDMPRNPYHVNDAAMRGLWNHFLAELDDMGVLLFTAAGNKGMQGGILADNYPAYLGKPDNNLMTVGGVYMNGTYWVHTSRESPAGGSISIYAPAADVLALGGHGVVQHGYLGESSTATAITVSSSIPC